MTREVKHCDDKTPLIAVAELGRMGDIVTSEPIYHYLKQRYPERRLCWFTKPQYAEILQYSPDVDEVVTVKNEAEYLALKRDFPEGTLAFELNFRSLPNPAEVKFDDFPHTSLLKSFALGAKLPALDDTPVWHFRPEVELPELPERYVVIHCVSGGKARQWTIAKWRRLVRFLLAGGMPVVEIGENPLVQSRHADFHDCTGRMDLHVAAKIIQNAAFFVGVESGFGHIANAVGARSIIISGKWHNFDDYNHYCGRYGRGEGVAFARLDKVLPMRFPYDVAEAIVRRFLDGKPMDDAECRQYCRERQIKDYPQNVLFRIREALIYPWVALQQKIEFHQIKHQKPRR